MTCKKLLLLSIFIHCCSSIFSQTKLFEYQLSNNTSLSASHYAINRSDKLIGLTLISNEKIDHILLSDGIELKKHFSQYQFSKKNKSSDTLSSLSKSVSDVYKNRYLGGNVSTNAIEEFFIDKDEHYIFVLSTDISSGKTIVVDTITLSKTQNLATAFSSNNTFYVVSYFTNSNTIKIYQKRVEHKTNARFKDITIDDIYLNGAEGSKVKNRINNFIDFFKSPYAIIENGKEYPLAITSQLNKLYIFPEKLIFTLDNQYMATTAIEMSLTDLSYKAKNYYQPFVYDDRYFYYKISSSNSFLLDSTLIQTNLINDKFHLAFTNKSTGYQNRIYSAQQGEAMSIAHGQIIQKEYTSKKEKIKNVSFGQLLTKISENAIAISAARSNDTIINTNIGSLYDKKSFTFASTLLSLGLSALGTYAINSIPNTYGFAIFVAGIETKNNTIAFQSAFDNRNFLPVEGIAKSEKNDTIQNFIKHNHISNENILLVQSKDQYLLGSYDKKTNRYIINSF